MELIQCRFCKAYIPDQSRFCGYCGNAVGDVSTPTVHTPIPPNAPLRQEEGVVPPNYATQPFNSAFLGNPSDPANGQPPPFYPSSPLQGTVPPGYAANPPVMSNPSFPARETPLPIVPTEGPFLPPQQGPSGISEQDMSQIVNDDVFDIENWPFPVSSGQTATNDPPTVRRRDEDEDDEIFPIPLIGGNNPSAPTPFVHGTPQPMNIPAASGVPQPVYNPPLSQQQALRPQLPQHQPAQAGFQSFKRTTHLPHTQVFKPHKHQYHHLVKPLAYAAVSVVVVASLVGAFVLTRAKSPTSPTGPAQISITSAGGAAPGATINVHGSNFVKGNPVAFSVNGRPVQSTDTHRTSMGSTSHLNAVQLAGVLVRSDQQEQEAGTPPVVQDDGTFDAALTIPSDLQPDSNNRYTITASEEHTNLSISITVNALLTTAPTPEPTPTKVPTKKSNATPQPTPAAPVSPTPTPVPPTPTPIVPTPTPIPRPASTACVQVNPGSLNFSMQTGQTARGTHSVTVINCGSAGTVNIATNAGWLSASAGSVQLKAGHSRGIDIRVSGQGLAAGRYTGLVTFTNGSSSATVRVRLVITEVCTFQAIDPINFIMQEGQPDPAPYDLRIFNGCSMAQTDITSISPASASWLNVKPGGALIKAGESYDFAIIASGKGLQPGRYSAQLTFSDATSSTTTDVTLTITNVVPCSFTVSADSISFTMTPNHTPSNKTFTVIPKGNCGPGDSASVTASVNDETSWLGASPKAVSLGNGPQTVTVSIIDDSLSVGTHTGTVTVSGGSTTAKVGITDTVNEPPTVTPTPPCTSGPNDPGESECGRVTPTPTMTPTPIVTPTVAPTVTPCTYTVRPSHLDFAATVTPSSSSADNGSLSLGIFNPTVNGGGLSKSVTVTPDNCGASDSESVSASGGEWLSTNVNSVRLDGAKSFDVTVCTCVGVGTHYGSVQVGNKSVSVTFTVTTTAVTPTPTPYPSPTPTPKPIVTPTPTPYPTPTPKPTLAPAPKPTPIPVRPTPTPKPYPTPTPKPYPTATPKPYPTPTPVPEQPTPYPTPKKHHKTPTPSG